MEVEALSRWGCFEEGTLIGGRSMKKSPVKKKGGKPKRRLPRSTSTSMKNHDRTSARRKRRT